MRFRFGSEDSAAERTFEAQVVGAVLVAFCIGAGIPLPARAQKSISVIHGQVVLEFVVSLSEPPRYRRT